MADGSIRLYDHHQQEKLVDESVTDDRRAIPTGFDGVDSLLRRGGLLPGNFVLLGGRTGTRKSTIMVNMMVSMAQANIPVGLVGLDEAPWTYVVKLMSGWSGKSQDEIEEQWETDEGKEFRREYKAWAANQVHIFGGRRPGIEHLDAAMELASMGSSNAPEVLFVDYLAQMSRSGPYAYGDNSRLPRLVEDMQIWSTENGVVVVTLHQLSRNDEFGGTNNRNAGHLPVTLTQLKYGGEEQSDIVLGTYRPAMNPMALMPMSIAKEVLGDRFDEDLYWEAKALAKKYENSTFLQLLKNRPGTHREERGIELVSPNESMWMLEKEASEPTRRERDEQETANRA